MNKKKHSPLSAGIILIVIQVLPMIVLKEIYIPENFIEGIGYYIFGIFGVLIIIANIIRNIKNKKEK